MNEQSTIAFFLFNLSGGGAEKRTITMVEAISSRGYQVDLVLCKVEGVLLKQMPAGIKVIGLEASPAWLAKAYAVAADPGGFRALLRPFLATRKPPVPLLCLPALVNYLRRVRPLAMIAMMQHQNLVAVQARRLARVNTRIIVSERNAISYEIGAASKDWSLRFLAPLLQRLYPQADAIVAVSKGVADDLAACTGISRDLITTIYNPVVSADLIAKASLPLDHPWFTPGAPPVILGIGRLVPQKDFPTLIRAFARVRAVRPAHLIILGYHLNPKKTNERREALVQLTRDLGVADDVELPGFVDNPYAYMARAAALVLSSIHEGLPGVLIEAMACGCPVVSTDCVSGPREILDNGRFGPLVPVGDDYALSQAILKTLDHPIDRDRLRRRADLFAVDTAVDQYLDLLRNDSKSA